MILSALRKLQHLFEENLRLNYPLAMRIPRGLEPPLPLEFLKPDYTSISIALPVSPIRITMGDDQTVDNMMESIRDFLAEWTSQFEAKLSRLSISNLYLEYNPESEDPQTVLRFDFVPWSYDGMVLSYLKLTSPQQYYEQPRWELDGYEVRTETHQHQLLKTEAVEVNVWLPNILSHARSFEGTTFKYLQSLSRDLRERTQEAQNKINDMYELANMHDKVNDMLDSISKRTHVDTVQQATVLVADTLKTEVTSQSLRGKFYFIIDSQYIEPCFLFQHAVQRQGDSND